MRRNAYQYDYFERGVERELSLYSNYRWIPELTVPMAMAISDYLGISRGQKILDIGCAKGFLVKAFRWLGRPAWGCDISDYALQTADPDAKRYLTKNLPLDRFSHAIAKDVLEHIRLRDLRRLLTKLNAHVLFIVVPLGDGRKYNLSAYERDVTHIHRQPLEWWKHILEDSGWKVKSSVLRVKGLKDNWSYEKLANGFIVAEKNLDEFAKRI